jgi:predicted amidohydrolase
MDVKLGERAHNVSRILAAIEDACKNGARLVAFPECATTGYCFDTLDEVRCVAEPIPGPTTARLAEACRAHRAYVVVGMVESCESRLFNACALIGPDGLIGGYRKVHLPYLGVDRFADPGDNPFHVWHALGLRVGMNICYDGSFPESSRVLALEGADLIVLPTNWPPAAACAADYVINTRAMENHVYYLAVNRIGSERGFTFIGRSRICDPTGRTLAAADHDQEAILQVEIDPELARNKHLVRIPGKHEIDRFADRRPEMYGLVSAMLPKALTPRDRLAKSGARI